MRMNKKFKNRRRELGLTMLDVAKKVGVSEATISRWESGYIANMRRDKIALLAKALEVTPSFIMDDECDEIPKNKDDFVLTPHEQTVITQYRAKPHLQEAVDKLLDVPPEPRRQEKGKNDIAQCRKPASR